MVQVWHDLLFAHWPVAAGGIRHLIPAPLVLDRYDGQAWIAVAPFKMTGIRLRGLPPLPGISETLELNVRTHVRLEDRPGVFFFSLDAASRVAVAVARRWFHLPYFHAEMSLRFAGGAMECQSRRVQRGAPAAEFRGRYRPSGGVLHARPGCLDHWLTERYCLYAVNAHGLFRADIHHAPWPLQPAQAEIDVNTMTQAAGIKLPSGNPLLHFARRLEVLVWSPERVGEGRANSGAAPVVEDRP
jgi:uncharacterized protein YqjF (DUF2071 family)